MTSVYKEVIQTFLSEMKKKGLECTNASGNVLYPTYESSGKEYFHFHVKNLGTFRLCLTDKTLNHYASTEEGQDKKSVQLVVVLVKKMMKEVSLKNMFKGENQ